MRAKHWEAIYKALGDEKPMSTTYIDDPEETWFAVLNQGIYVWSSGTLHKEAFVSPAKVCDQRQVFYHQQKSLYVELAVYDDVGVLTCAVDNGYMRQFSFEPEALEERAVHYLSKGFTRVGDWHLDTHQVVVREYRSQKDRRVVRVDGEALYVGHEEFPCSSRGEAKSLAEERIAGFLQDSFALVLIETMSAHHENPAPVTPLEIPTLTSWPEPQSAEEAVDQAMARLEELHRLFPAANALLELIELPREAERAAELVPRRFPEHLYRGKSAARGGAAANSFEYFRARYKTVTWALLNSWKGADDYIETYESPNEHGATCALEIADALPYTKVDADERGRPELVHFSRFERGFVFDTRFTSESGEHPILAFRHIATAVEPEEIQPFGFWLLGRVTQLSNDVLPWLVKTQG